MSKTFEENLVTYTPNSPGPPVPLPSGGNLLQQLINAVAALFGSGIDKLAPTPSSQPIPTKGMRNLRDEAEIHAPHDPTEGAWKGGDPCKKD